MKKMIIGGVLTLFTVGAALAAITGKAVSITPESSVLERAIAEVTVIGVGVDEGGFYYILSDGDSCRKVYPPKDPVDICEIDPC